MAGLRDHEPITIEEFNGLYDRGSVDSVPQDHFSDCNNIQFGDSSFRTRDAIDIYAAYANTVRIYTFNQETGQSLLVLDESGNIYDTGSATPFTPILSISGMTDFDFVVVAGRAFITPSNGITGLANQYVYVYEGDGTPARVAAGSGPVDADGVMLAANSATVGNVEAGVHIFGAVYERNTGALSNIGPVTLAVVTATGGFKVDLTSIPETTDASVVNVHIVATKAIQPSFYTGDTRGYEFFKVPGAVVTNGVNTLSVSFFDSELLDNWTYLQDLFTQIPAGVGMSSYHGRLLVWATSDNPSVCYASAIGEPEAVNQVDGLLIFPLDGNPITRCQEFRDVLYGFKATRTVAWNDNGDEPAAWPLTLLDGGLGCSVHGIATVLDSAGINVDFLICVNYGGIYAFNGTFIQPELSWKISQWWLNNVDRDEFRKIQIFNDTIKKLLYAVLPDGRLLHGDYTNQFDYKSIKWTPMSFDAYITSIALIDTNVLVLSSKGPV